MGWVASRLPVFGTGLADVVLDSTGNLFVSDFTANKIWKLAPGGSATVFAGSGTAGHTNATGTAATFTHPKGLAVDASDNLIVCETNQIRLVTPAGVVSLLAGGSTSGYVDATGAAARFGFVESAAVDAAGTVYVTNGAGAVRTITPAGVVTTLAGSTATGYADATGAAALFDNTRGITLDTAGNAYVIDANNHAVRKITPAGVVTTVATVDPTSSSLLDIATGPDGAFYITQGFGELLRLSTSGAWQTLYAFPDSGAFGVTVDTSGGVYVVNTTHTWVDLITYDPDTGGFEPEDFPPYDTADDPPYDIPDAPAVPEPACASILQLIQEFSAATRRAVRLTGPATITMVDPIAALPAGWTQLDADAIYHSTTHALKAGEKVLSLLAGDLALSATAALVADDVRLLTSGWRIPDRLPVYGLHPAPVQRITYTFSPQGCTASVEFAFHSVPLALRRT
jgi:sugar lactone lactonase YvrE